MATAFCGLDSAAAVEEMPASLVGADGLEARLERLPGGQVRVEIGRPAAEGELQRLTWKDAAAWLHAESPALRGLLSEVLLRVPFDAYYWECPPLSKATAKHRSFEFVVLEAPHLAVIEADRWPFEEYLSDSRGQEVSRSFYNLGGDSMLVAPAQAIDNMQAYAHIANFFRMAPEAQRDAQWRELGKALEQHLSRIGPKTSIWVSTEGSGVYWLHMRLDPRPKYYHFAAYRDPNYGSDGREL